MKNIKIINNKGFILIAALIVMVTSILLMSLYSNIILTEKGLIVKDYHKKQAFWLAEAGNEKALKAVIDDLALLTDSQYWIDNFTNVLLGEGVYTVEISEDSGVYTLTSKGTTRGITVTIKQGVIIGSGVVPESFKYAIYVGGKIDDKDAINLSITGDQVEGGADLPIVDFSYFKSIADSGQDISGNYTFSDEGSGTDYSGVWFVDGNVIVESGVTITGSIIATGGIAMRGNSTISITAASPNPALVAYGNIDLKNTRDVTIFGLIYAGADKEGNVDIKEALNLNITGTVIAGGNFDLKDSDSATITYDNSIVIDPPPGFGTIVLRNDWRQAKKREAPFTLTDIYFLPKIIICQAKLA